MIYSQAAQRRYVLSAIVLILVMTVLATAAGTEAADSGDVLWVNSSGRTEQDYAWPRGIAVKDGSVYILGYWSSFAYPYPSSLWAFKYGADGSLKWSQGYGQAGATVVSGALAVDDDGNVFAVAQLLDPAEAYLTVKFDAENGAVMWAQRLAVPDNGLWRPWDIAVDADGNVYITGSSKKKTIDYLTVSYDPEGNLRWRRSYDGPAHGDDRAQAITVQGSAVYVSGFSWGGSTPGDDWATIKYDLNGRQLWVRRLDAGYRVADIAADRQGNVVVGGIQPGATINGKYTGEQDLLTAKYDAAGRLRWTRRYNGPGFGKDWFHDLALDARGNVYVAGTAEGKGQTATGPNEDYVTLKYDAGGAPAWAKRYNGTGNYHDIAVGIAVNGATGDVYVTGKSFGGASYNDYATVKYNSAGRQQWVRRYSGVPYSGPDDSGGAGVAVDDTGVYVTGSAAQNITTLKYAP